MINSASILGLARKGGNFKDPFPTIERGIGMTQKGEGIRK